LLVACLVVVVQGTRMAYRVAGPEHRLIQSLRRVRKGDLAFRVSLRRGDLLSGLAQECNELLDYLNTNPPSGAKTGTDVVDVAFEDEVREATLEEARS
jgi:nitrogen fixation/metabolism regulation signal transduction histidine kinase